MRLSRLEAVKETMFQHHRCLLVFAATAHGFRPPPSAKAHLQRRAVDDEVQVYDGVFAPRDLEALDVASNDAAHRAFDRSAGVGTILEAALDSFLGELGDESRFVEYWARDVWKHIEAHADVDEAEAKAGGELRYPTHGHVLGVQVGAEVAGPTVVFGRRGDVLTSAPAVAGRVVRFAGDLVHAVPRPADVWLRSFVTAVPSTAAHRRSVVLFNTWDAPPRDVALEPEYALPFRDAPVRAAPRTGWVAAAATEDDGGGGAVALKVPRLGDGHRRAGQPRHFSATAAAGLAAALGEQTAVRAVSLHTP